MDHSLINYWDPIKQMYVAQAEPPKGEEVKGGGDEPGRDAGGDGGGDGEGGVDGVVSGESEGDAKVDAGGDAEVDAGKTQTRRRGRK